MDHRDFDYFDTDERDVRRPLEREDPSEDYTTKWPAGYWDTYETLKTQARGYKPGANMLMRMDGHFEVRFMGSDGNIYNGPAGYDRHEALQRFIDGKGAGVKRQDTQKFVEVVDLATKLRSRASAGV